MIDRRSLLKWMLAAAATPSLLHARARQAGEPFALGVASGGPDHQSVVLWTRISGVAAGTPAVGVRWELAEDEAFRRIVQKGDYSAVPELGYSVHVEPKGLAPDRWYFYRFFTGDAQSPVGRTRTFPGPGVMAAKLRFALASCQRWEAGYYAAYRHMLADAPDCVVFVGDYIYERPLAKKNALRVTNVAYPQNLADYRDLYAAYKSDPDLQAMHAACPWLLTWDDHEVQNNYAGLRGLGSDSDFVARRAAAYQAYYENMPLRGNTLLRGLGGLIAGKEDALRIYTRVNFGRLASFQILDDRQYRDWQACRDPANQGESITPSKCEEWSAPQRTLLGAEQEQWLDKALASCASEGTAWSVIANQTVFSLRDSKIGAGERYGTDGWSGYPAARQRVIASIQRHSPRNPVFIGGDIHQNWVADVYADGKRAEGAQPIAAEFVGTSISSSSDTTQKQADAVLAENPGCLLSNPIKRGYGLVDVTPTQWRSQLRVLDDVRLADSGASTLATFVVEDGRAGIQRA